MTEKQHLFDFCQTFINDRIARIHKNITNIQESLSSETKSSAGDKHETGRAMLQLEREKLGQQLAEAEKMQEILSKVILDKKTIIGLGSLVETNNSSYFLAISAGEAKIKDAKFYCISAGTPIAQLLLGKTVGDSYVFNGRTYKVVGVS